ncbi:hypothetical protein AnigIFM56816_000818 [Aspergillus niger]|nr:hypothetical protein AnigIFM56816_000818 [Aspergillus niger]
MPFAGRTIIPPGALILVTGVNGQIGSHVARQLLEAGYRVRGTVRDSSKSKWVHELFDQKPGKGRFESVVIKDITADGAFNDAMKGVSAIAHVASTVNMSPDPNVVIPETIAAVLSCLKSAAKERSVKRFVYTSSTMACQSVKPEERTMITSSMWNDEAVTQAWAPPPYTPDRGVTVYAASKTEAERALWKYAQDNKLHFDVNSIAPDHCAGEMLHHSQFSSTSGVIASVILSPEEVKEKSKMSGTKRWYVDVTDVARLHVVCLVSDHVQNERILAAGEPFRWNKVLATIRELDPQREVPLDDPNEPDAYVSMDNVRGQELLQEYYGEGWTSLEVSVKRVAQTCN